MSHETLHPETTRRHRFSALRRRLGHHGLSNDEGYPESLVEANGYLIISDDDGQPRYEAQVQHMTSDAGKAVGDTLPSDDGDFLLGSAKKVPATGVDDIGTYSDPNFATTIHRYVEARASVMPTGEPHIERHGYVVEETVDENGFHTFVAKEQPLIDDMLRVRHGSIPMRKGSTWVYGRPLSPEKKVPVSATTPQSLEYGRIVSAVKAAIQRLTPPDVPAMADIPSRKSVS